MSNSNNRENRYLNDWGTLSSYIAFPDWIKYREMLNLSMSWILFLYFTESGNAIADALETISPPLAIICFTDNKIAQSKIIYFGFQKSVYGIFWRTDNGFTVVERSIQHDGHTADLVKFRN